MWKKYIFQLNIEECVTYIDFSKLDELVESLLTNMFLSFTKPIWPLDVDSVPGENSAPLRMSKWPWTHHHTLLNIQVFIHTLTKGKICICLREPQWGSEGIIYYSSTLVKQRILSTCFNSSIGTIVYKLLSHWPVILSPFLISKTNNK